MGTSRDRRRFALDIRDRIRSHLGASGVVCLAIHEGDEMSESAKYIELMHRLAGVPDIHPWQADVREFHIGLGLATGDYSNPTGLGGDTLALRIRLLKEEFDELKSAVYASDIVETVDGLVDIAYIVLGSFDVAGVVCRTRFGLLTDTGAYRGFNGFQEKARRGLCSVDFFVDQALDIMGQHAVQHSEFRRWDLLEAVMIEVAHCFCALGIDPRPMWTEVNSSNMRKVGGPINEHGKKLKPAGWVGPDIAGELRKQGAVL